MNRKPYPSDLTDSEWAILEPLVPAAKPGGRPRTVEMRKVLNGIFYMLKTGCQWDHLPHDFPPKGTVYGLQCMAQERDLGGMEPSIERAGARERRARANAQRGEYRQSERQDDGKRGPRGYDAGKKVKGRKRTILVDTLGLLLKVVVHEADVQDRDGAIWLLLAITGLFPRLVKLWVDGAYRGSFVTWAKEVVGLDIEVVERDKETKGFTLLPRRWVVERTFSWLSNYRRLSKDYEYHFQPSEAMIYAAMVHLMVRRLAAQQEAV